MKNTPQYDIDTLKAFVQGTLSEQLAQEIATQEKESENLAAKIAGIRFTLGENRDEPIEAYLGRTERQQQLIIEKHFATKRKDYRQKQWSVAAAVAVLIGVGLWGAFFGFRDASPRKLAIAHLTQPYAIREYNNRGAKSPNKLEKEWHQAYRDGQYDRVVELLGPQVERGEEASFYFGSTLLYLEYPRRAIPPLEKVLQTGNPEGYEENARWYLAIAYLLDNDPDSAVPLLREIVEKNRHYKQKAAMKLLKELPSGEREQE